ncbi:MAG: phosphomannomutase/phosphoglucomutase [Gammaproteobacteria bacterium]|nr:phosphomannomutase/phosphoglucomutase [Gammaproteobacteria bacterium]
MTIDATIFRAYDIRGIVDNNITAEGFHQLGQALASEAIAHGQSQMIVGRDGRLSGPTLTQALIAGILSTGCDVIDIGQAPTPLLYFATHILSANCGAVVTASHNPAEYNGLKMVIDGERLSGERIQKLHQASSAGQFAQGQGKLQQENVIERYIDHICHHIKLARPLKVVIDCGHGVAGDLAPRLYRQLGCDVIELFCEVDGNFPAHHPDPTQVENLTDLIAAVKSHHADVGIALDGDGDRLGIVTDKGEIIWPDRQMILYSMDLLQRHPGATVVYDVKSTQHLERAIRQMGGHPIMSKTGHSFVEAKIRESGALLAGEMSGHLFFNDDNWFGFDDGLYSGIRLLDILAKQQKSSSALFAEIPDSINTPELAIKVNETEKFSLMEKIQSQLHFDGAERVTIDGLRINFPNNSWGLIRASNTSPILTLRFEAESQTELAEIQRQFQQQLQKIDPRLAW